MHKPNWQARQIPNAYDVILVINLCSTLSALQKSGKRWVRSKSSHCVAVVNLFSVPINVLQDRCVVWRMDRSGNRRPVQRQQTANIVLNHSHFGIMPWHNVTIGIPIQANWAIYQILQLIGQVEASWSVVTGLGVHRFSVDGWTERCPASSHLCMPRPCGQEHT